MKNLLLALLLFATAGTAQANVSPAQAEQIRSRIMLLQDDLNKVRSYLQDQNLSPNRLQREQEVQAWNLYSNNLVVLKRATRIEEMRGASSPLWSDIARLKRIEISGIKLRERLVKQEEGDEGLEDTLSDYAQ